ncbi:MAG: hypothetical protein M1831_005558 [Alyxoria varia]|nr:MAG: hypothetical protein M1831_005558 [Alyxoria varia]
MAPTANANEELSSLLRFLQNTAKLPLARALSAAKPLLAANLKSNAAIASESSLVQLTEVLSGDDKLAKQIHAAAKRSEKSGKRGSSAIDDGGSAAGNKRRTKVATEGAAASEVEKELALALPGLPSNEETSQRDDEDTIASTTIETNRAPLFLAFAIVALKYTHPEQPLSSRLSLAQAVVSANAKSKAESIGVEEKGRENEGPGKGFKATKILGREIAVLRRDVAPGGHDQSSADPPLWGVDMAALEKKDTSSKMGSSAQLPIHRPEAARSYLLRSFLSPDKQTNRSRNSASTKQSGADDKHKPLAHLLQALDMLFSSWANTTLSLQEGPRTRDDVSTKRPGLNAAQLDSRAWDWYTRVRPRVEPGVAGWGAKGSVDFKEILALRRHHAT